MNQYYARFEVAGVVQRLRRQEIPTKKGGRPFVVHDATLATLGDSVEVRLNEDQYKTLIESQEVIATGNVTSRNYRTSLEVTRIRPLEIKPPAAKAQPLAAV
jgi:hypothetical protein